MAYDIQDTEMIVKLGKRGEPLNANLPAIAKP